MSNKMKKKTERNKTEKRQKAVTRDTNWWVYQPVRGEGVFCSTKRTFDESSKHLLIRKCLKSFSHSQQRLTTQVSYKARRKKVSAKTADKEAL